MNAFTRYRLLHLAVAAGFTVAYFTGDDGANWHIWAGYWLITALLIRLLAGWLGLKGLPRWLPERGALARDPVRVASRMLVVLQLVAMLGASVTGLMLIDNVRFLGLENTTVAAWIPAPALADGMEEDDSLAEVHEFFANGALTLVIAHIGLVWFTRRQQATRMLFLPQKSQQALKNAIR